jgi:hypothetical protein
MALGMQTTGLLDTIFAIVMLSRSSRPSFYLGLRERSEIYVVIITPHKFANFERSTSPPLTPTHVNKCDIPRLSTSTVIAPPSFVPL